jgi:hypothetical protein
MNPVNRFGLAIMILSIYLMVMSMFLNLYKGDNLGWILLGCSALVSAGFAFLILDFKE